MIALLDTCVLFPRVLRDTLLDAALAELYVLRWSHQILDELRRNLIKHRNVHAEDAARLLAAMDYTFPEAAVVGFESLISSMTNHPKDRHVLAAAVHGDARLLVTSNLVDFHPVALAQHGVGVYSPDDFVQLLFSLAPDQMVQVIVDQAASYHRPPVSVDELLDRLAKHAPGVPILFAAARS